MQGASWDDVGGGEGVRRGGRRGQIYSKTYNVGSSHCLFWFAWGGAKGELVNILLTKHQNNNKFECQTERFFIVLGYVRGVEQEVVRSLARECRGAVGRLGMGGGR